MKDLREELDAIRNRVGLPARNRHFRKHKRALRSISTRVETTAIETVKSTKKVVPVLAEAALLTVFSLAEVGATIINGIFFPEKTNKRR